MPSKAVRRKYDFLAWAYDWIYRGYIRKTNRLALEAIPLRGDEKILNVGCGTGELEKRLFRKYPHLHSVGIDISEDMLKRAREKLAAHPNALFQEGDFLKVAFPENNFDIAFSISNFHYFTNPSAVLEKIGRLLKKNGSFVLIDWNRDSFQGKLYNKFLRRFDRSLVKVYTASEVKKFLEKTGFQLQRVDLFGVDLRWRMMRLIAKKS